MTMLETTGRKSGQPRRTAIGGRVIGNEFWMVSEHGEHSHYVLNIKADPGGAATAARPVAHRHRASAARRRRERAAAGSAWCQQRAGAG